MGFEVVALFLWEFIKPILSDTMKDKLKERLSSTDPSKKAKITAFRLYEALGELRDKTEQYVKTFREVIQSLEEEKPEKIIHRRRVEFVEVSEDLRKELAYLAEVMKNIYPQLEIHNPEIVANIKEFHLSRDGIADEFADMLEHYDNLGKQMEEYSEERLVRLFRKSEINLELVRKATDDFREFLAREFPFKDSF